MSIEKMSGTCVKLLTFTLFGTVAERSRATRATGESAQGQTIRTTEDAAAKLLQQKPVKVEPKFSEADFRLAFDKVEFSSVSLQPIAKLGSRCEPGAVAPLYSTFVGSRARPSS